MTQQDKRTQADRELDWATSRELERKDAEITRLREQLHYANGTCDLAMKHRASAESENERLRAALQSIADQCDDEDGGVLIRIAERALANEQSSGD